MDKIYKKVLGEIFYNEELKWFEGHSVTVYGDIENGCTDTAIEG